jgi:hypothetical protein
MLNILIGWYNKVVEYINKIFHLSIPTIPGLVTVPTTSSPAERFASGGKPGSGWWMAGERGFELVDPTGYVHPHDESMSLLKLLGGVRGFASGGSPVGGGGNSILDALRQAQMALAGAMSGFSQMAAGSMGGFGPMAAAGAAGGNTSQSFAFYAPVTIGSDQDPGSLGDVLIKDRRF